MRHKTKYMRRLQQEKAGMRGLRKARSSGMIHFRFKDFGPDHITLEDNTQNEQITS